MEHTTKKIFFLNKKIVIFLNDLFVHLPNFINFPVQNTESGASAGVWATAAAVAITAASAWACSLEGSLP